MPIKVRVTEGFFSCFLRVKVLGALTAVCLEHYGNLCKKLLRQCDLEPEFVVKMCFVLELCSVTF